MIRVSAPGKLMLMGEHAVVYGQPSLVTAVGERLSVVVEISGSNKTQIHAPQVNNTKFVDAALSAFFTQFKPGTGEQAVKLSTHSEFNNNLGFGSSSAVTVATLKALAMIFNVPLTDKELFDLAYQVVLSVQRVGSGFDVAAVVYGGTLYFKKGGNIIERCTQIAPLVIGYTGVKADTTSLVKMVARKRENDQVKVDRIFAAIGKLVDQGKKALEESDWQRLGTFFTYNQEYLRDLGVSSEKLESLISAANNAGAYGAKLSGAGGGDCMIAVVDEPRRSKVEQAIAETGATVIRVPIGAPGVRIETSDDQAELFVVVDKNDNVIGHKTRAECHNDKSLLHRAIEVLIFDNQGRVLLQKRSLSKDTSPGCWSVSVGGHVAQDESYEEAAQREMKEELGVNGLPLAVKTKFIHEYSMETEMETVFTAQHNGPFRPHQGEIDQVKFFTKEELRQAVLTRQIELTSIAQLALRLVDYL